MDLKHYCCDCDNIFLVDRMHIMKNGKDRPTQTKHSPEPLEKKPTIV